MESFSGNASKITTHLFRIFDSDGNDFLDFKEFLLAIDIANRDSGIFNNFNRIAHGPFITCVPQGGGEKIPILFFINA